MAGYTDTFLKVNGDLIEAPTFKTEYQKLGATFDQVTGHKHDGTAAEGAFIPLIADSANLNAVLCDAVNDLIDFSVNVAGTKTSQLKLVDGALAPTIPSDVDLGTVGSGFKDIYAATINGAVISGGTY